MPCALINLSDDRFQNSAIPGYSFIQKNHLLRQAVQLGHFMAKEMLVGMKQITKSFCAYCFQMESEYAQHLKRCQKCKAAWYFVKSRQKVHRKLGLKTDCVEELDCCQSQIDAV